MFLDLGLFGKAILPRVLSQATPQFHNQIFDLLLSDSRRRGVIAPRGHAKSTICSLLYPLYRTLFKHPDEQRFILIVSERQNQAKDFLASIKFHLETNPYVHRYFGDITQDVNWTQDDIITKNNVRIVAAGTGQRLRGINFRSQRPTDVILDDFESEKNTLTQEIRQQNQDWIAGTIEPTLDPILGRLTAIGTIAHQDTYLAKLPKDPRFNENYLFFQAIMDGKAIWPERYSKKMLMAELDALRAVGKEHIWYREYMNEPRNPEDAGFKNEDFRYWDGEIKVKAGYPVLVERHENGKTSERPVNVFVGVDPAISKRGDYTTIVPVAIDAEGNLYVDDYYRGRAEPHEIIEKLFEFKFKYAPTVFAIETTAYQQALVSFLKREMQLRGIYFPVRELKPRDQKNVRLLALEPFVKAHQLHMKKRHTELEAEMQAFPKGQHDDLLDGLWNAQHFATAPVRDWTDWDEGREPFVPDSWRVL